MEQPDPRRRVPSTDRILADDRLAEATSRFGPRDLRVAVHAAQELARTGQIAPESVADAAAQALPSGPSSLRPVLNATGVVVHTNLGRAPLSASAVAAVVAAAGYTDVELDLSSGRRAARGAGAREALLAAVPGADPGRHAALVVNNGAAALALAVAALAGGREVVVSRGELVEIGDGFRLPDLMTSAGARLREVGTTNRTTSADYRAALGPDVGAVVKIHPGNFRVEGFTGQVPVAELAGLGVPVVCDVGSGLLAPDPRLPAEPDISGALRAGAAVVTASGDKLLGGPQAGLVLGTAEHVERLRRHPLARAFRVDKLTLAALEATLRGPGTPVAAALAADPDHLRDRALALAELTGGLAVPHDGVVGGGGAPGVLLPGWAVALPETLAEPLRLGDPVVLGRVEGGRLLLDLRCVPAGLDLALADAVQTAARRGGTG